MRYLAPEQILFLHARIISETGGSHGVRDIGLLQSAIARPQATFEGRDLYGGIFAKAAALMHSLVQNHPFLDGNKRTAIGAVVLFLRLNGYQIMVSNQQVEAFALNVAKGKYDHAAIASWLKQHAERWS